MKQPRKIPIGRPSKAILYATALILLLLSGIYLTVAVIISTPYTSLRLSKFMTELLHQPVSVEGLSLSGMTITARQVSIANPAGFAGGNVAAARSVSVAPDLFGLLRRKRSFSRISIRGLVVDLRKNRAGEWNFAEISKYFGRKREKPAEVFIHRLDLDSAALRWGNFVMEPVSLVLKDLSTRGSTSSGVTASGRDNRGNLYILKADGRLGKDPDLKVELTAPAFSLDFLRSRYPKIFDRSLPAAKVAITAGYRKGFATADLKAGVAIPRASDGTSSQGGIAASTTYDVARDEVRLKGFEASLNGKILLAAAGVVHGVRSVRKFDMYIQRAEIPAGEIVSLIPAAMRRQIRIDGAIRCSGFRLTGGRSGLTGGKGRIFIRGGTFSKNGVIEFSGISSDMTLSGTDRGWELEGKTSADGSYRDMQITGVRGLFRVLLNRRFRISYAEIGRVEAEVERIPLKGSASYSPSDVEPIRATVSVTGAPLATLNRYLGKKGITLSSGKADFLLRVTGRGSRSYSGEIEATTAGLAGASKTGRVSAKRVEITSRFANKEGKITATGRIGAAGGAYGTKAFSAASAFGLDGRTLSLTGAEVVFDKTSIRVGLLRGTLPTPGSDVPQALYPIAAEFSGVTLAQGDYRATGGSGNISCTYGAGNGRKEFNGRISAGFPKLVFRGREIGALSASGTFAKGNGIFSLNGKLFEGTLTSSLRVTTSSERNAFGFDATVKEVSLPAVTAALPAGMAIRPTAGRLNGVGHGTWSSGKLNCRIEATAGNVALGGVNGKNVLSGFDMKADGIIKNGDVSLRHAVLNHGGDINIKIEGGMSRALSSHRTGRFSFSSEPAPARAIIALAAPVLPQHFKDWTSAGMVAVNGGLGIDSGNVHLDGNINIEGVRIGVPSQKLSVDGADGVIPISLVFPGSRPEKSAQTRPVTFSRQNYPVLLKQMLREDEGASLLRIASVRFGAVEIGDIRIRARKEKGRTEFSSIQSSVYNGRALGTGYLYYGRGLRYGVDLLLNDVSLRLFCSSYPALKGYISGLVDGVVSFQGNPEKDERLAGFANLWAHEGKGEKKLVSKEFLQKLAGKKLRGFFFRDDRSYDTGEITLFLQKGYVTFEHLELSHTNLLGMKDLNVSVAPVQNRIALDHLLQSIREAAARGKATTEKPAAPEAPAEPDVKWLE